MSEANKAIVRQIEEAWNANQIDKLDALFAPNFIQLSGMPGMTPTMETAKQAHQMSVLAMPDRKTVIEELLADGDKVAVRVRMTGTNTGGFPWFNIPANGNNVDVQWISIYGLKDGKVVEHQAIMDVMGLMQQLGAIPSS